MTSFYFAFHMIIVISWMIFMLLFIKAYQYQKKIDGFIFGFLSIFFLFLAFGLGIKLINLDTAILKSGGWLHLKITLAVVLGLINIYYFLKFLLKKSISKKISEIIFWLSYIIFMFNLYLTLFRPF